MQHVNPFSRHPTAAPFSLQVKGKPRRSEGAGGGGPGTSSSKSRGRRTTIGAKSLGAQFRENLNNLVLTVDKTHPHYVRTIKPNDDLSPANFTFDRIAEQLRNAGVLEVVRVARAGFPVRLGIQVGGTTVLGFCFPFFGFAFSGYVFFNGGGGRGGGCLMVRWLETLFGSTVCIWRQGWVLILSLGCDFILFVTRWF